MATSHSTCGANSANCEVRCEVFRFSGFGDRDRVGPVGLLCGVTAVSFPFGPKIIPNQSVARRDETPEEVNNLHTSATHYIAARSEPAAVETDCQTPHSIRVVLEFCF